MSEPRTAAGRALLARWRVPSVGTSMRNEYDLDVKAILAIEAEASTGLRAALERLLQYSWSIHLAGTPNEQEAIRLIEQARAIFAELQKQP